MQMCMCMFKGVFCAWAMCVVVLSCVLCVVLCCVVLCVWLLCVGYCVLCCMCMLCLVLCSVLSSRVFCCAVLCCGVLCVGSVMIVTFVSVHRCVLIMRCCFMHVVLFHAYSVLHVVSGCTCVWVRVGVYCVM